MKPVNGTTSTFPGQLASLAESSLDGPALWRLLCFVFKCPVFAGDKYVFLIRLVVLPNGTLPV